MKEIAINELRDICIKALQGAGLDEKEATIVTEDHLDAEMRGKISHGLRFFDHAIDEAKSRGRYEKKIEKGNLLFIEGNEDMGNIVMRDAMDWAEGICESHGHALVGLRNIQRFATPGSIVDFAAREGLIALVFEYGGSALMSHPDGKEAVLSTNPIGIGIPTRDEPISVDMATSDRAFWLVRMARKQGIPIPADWGKDADGNPTTDPDALTSVNAFGGYKGFALAFMIEVITGVLTGTPVGLEAKQGSTRGAFCFFCTPTTFGLSEDEFYQKLDQLISEIHDSGDDILLPGERGVQRKKEILESGVIELEDDIYEALLTLR